MTEYRLVRHSRVIDFLMCGWSLTLADLEHHNEWSAMLYWPCTCRVAVPIDPMSAPTAEARAA